MYRLGLPLRPTSTSAANSTFVVTLIAVPIFHNWRIIVLHRTFTADKSGLMRWARGRGGGGRRGAGGGCVDKRHKLTSTLKLLSLVTKKTANTSDTYEQEKASFAIWDKVWAVAAESCTMKSPMCQRMTSVVNCRTISVATTPGQCSRQRPHGAAS